MFPIAVRRDDLKKRLSLRRAYQRASFVFGTSG